MPAKLSTTINKVKSLSNPENADLVLKFYEFMHYSGVSERHQNNNLKAIVSYSCFLGNKSIKEISKKDVYRNWMLFYCSDESQKQVE